MSKNSANRTRLYKAELSAKMVDATNGWADGTASFAGTVDSDKANTLLTPGKGYRIIEPGLRKKQERSAKRQQKKRGYISWLGTV